MKTSSHRHYSVGTDPFVFGIPMEIGQYDYYNKGGEEGKKEPVLMTAVSICSDVHDDKPRG